MTESPFMGVGEYDTICFQLLSVRMECLAEAQMYDEAIADAVALVEADLGVKWALEALERHLEAAGRTTSGNDAVDALLEVRRRSGRSHVA